MPTEANFDESRAQKINRFIAILLDIFEAVAMHAGRNTAAAFVFLRVCRAVF